MSSKYSEACSTAETFVHLFYDKMDTTKRNQIGKLYMDTASVSWNGNRIDGELPRLIQTALLNRANHQV